MAKTGRVTQSQGEKRGKPRGSGDSWEPDCRLPDNKCWEREKLVQERGIGDTKKVKKSALRKVATFGRNKTGEGLA